MPIPDAQGSTLTFDGATLGICQGVTANVKAANVHDFTSVRSPVVGTGANARVVRQFTCTSIDPGSITARFLGSPTLRRDDCGRPGTLTFTWPDGSLSYQAFFTDLTADFQKGELVQWAATFQFTGF